MIVLAIVFDDQPRATRRGEETWHAWERRLAPSVALLDAAFGKRREGGRVVARDLPPLPWSEFAARFAVELAATDAEAALRALCERSARGETITLLCYCADERAATGPSSARSWPGAAGRDRVPRAVGPVARHEPPRRIHCAMLDSGGQKTCWTLIQSAAGGDAGDRSLFSHRYLPVVRQFFAARWARAPLRDQIDDAVQEVFLECFRAGGVLHKADPKRPRGFRAFLLGVVTNVALRLERKKARKDARKAPGSFHPDERASHDDSISKIFDRAWAQSVMRQAAELMAERAEGAGATAQQRVELLRLRFEDDLPIREIAVLWGEDAAVLHRAYRKAREEFHACLRSVVSFHDPDADGDPDREWRLLAPLLD